MVEGQKFARKCSVTGEGMGDGYVFRDGDEYFSTEHLALIKVKALGYSSIKEAYLNGEIYWTEWEDDDYQYIVKNGELVEID